MQMYFPDYLPIEGKRLESLKIILSHMNIKERHNYFALSLPYFVVKNKKFYYEFCDEGTYLLITDENREPIAFAQPDLEDSFLEVGDDQVANNIYRQIRWLMRDVSRYPFNGDSYLKLCYIEAPEINISGVGLYNEVSKGPMFFVDSRSKVRFRTESALRMIELQHIKMRNLPDKGLSAFGVPPN